ncbi:MAG: acetate kinase [Bacteroidales bacterium]|nr:acetate kinase [Bacteroidales bacterium]
MKILVLNCGSSSLKYQLIDVGTRTVMAKGLLERIGLETGEFTHKYKGRVHTQTLSVPDHTTGLRIVMEALVDPVIGVISDLKEISAVGHRMAHGGAFFNKSCLITDEVMEKERSLTRLAPLHIPGNLMGVEAMRSVLPEVPQVGVFDTAFHMTIPPKNYLYGIPYEYVEKYGIRRYGFHGTSHRFVAKKGAQLIGKQWKDLKIISCHLGSGASICAIDHGKSLDTTMGMTSLEGLVMGSRCGDIDVGAVLYLMETAHIGVKEMNDILYRKSGLAGLSGGVQDMRDIRVGRDSGDPLCTNAFEVFAQRCKKYIGAYMCEMNGCDLLLFTGGIGENAWFMRHAILQDTDFLGIDVDMDLNDQVAGEDKVITKPGSRVTAMVVTTDEELAIALDTYKIVFGQGV